jgi:hypothetical protein
MDEARQLLQDILSALNAIPNASVPRKYAGSVRFANTYEIASEIGQFLRKVPEQIEEAFDPYTDPETRQMLELAGISTFPHRNRRR